MRTYRTTGRQLCNGRENSMTDNGRRPWSTIYSTHLVGQPMSTLRHSVDSEACPQHKDVVVQHTRCAGEVNGERFFDAGGWRRDGRVVNKLLRPSAGTLRKEATTTKVLIARTMRTKNEFFFLQLPFEKGTYREPTFVALCIGRLTRFLRCTSPIDVNVFTLLLVPALDQKQKRFPRSLRPW